MYTWALFLAMALAGEPASDPVVLRLYTIDRAVADPFAGQAPPAGVSIGKCSGGGNGPQWEQMCASVKSATPADLEATLAGVKPWFAALPGAKGDRFVFGLPTTGGGHDANSVAVLLVKGTPILEIHASDLASAKLEGRSVDLEWTPAGMARVSPATAALDGIYAFVVEGDRLATEAAFAAGNPLGGTTAQPNPTYSLMTTWGDDALGARVAKAVGGG